MDNEQNKFWIKVAQGISENIASATTQETNLILVNGDLPCLFDKDIEIAQGQMYQIGNKIVPWSITWDGSSGGDLFRQYQAFVENIFPTPKTTDPAVKEQLDDISNKITKLSAKVGSLLKQSIKVYMDDYCINVSPDGFHCNEALPGAPSLSDYIREYKESADYKSKVLALEEEYSDTLAGLQTKFEKLASDYYGENYQQLHLAKQAVAEADPNDLINSKPAYQMKIAQQGEPSSVPLFTSTQLQSYKQWLEVAKKAYENGDDPSVIISFSNKVETKHEEKWKFSTNAVIPVDYFFQLNISVAGDGDKVDMSKSEFDGILSYQDIIQIDVSPSNKWFFSNLFNLYKDYFDKHESEIFGNKKLWGVGGMLSTQVRSVIVGYGSSVKIQSDKWSQSDLYSHVKTNSSFGIGPIHFFNASTDNVTTKHNVTQTNSGLELTDTSGIAKIIGVILETPNYNN